MKAWIRDVRYIPSDYYSCIHTGYKGGTSPKGRLCRGGNGTFRVFSGTPADIKVYADTETGKRFSFSVGADVRRLGHYVNLTRKRGQRFINAKPYEVTLVQRGSRWEISERDLADWVWRAS